MLGESQILMAALQTKTETKNDMKTIGKHRVTWTKDELAYLI
jgi:hypothetical protein